MGGGGPLWVVRESWWLKWRTFIYTVISYTSNYLPTGEVSSRMIHQAGHYRDSLEDLSD